MTYQQRRAINRQNAEKSSGPSSSEGKARSARNGIVHGLTGERLLLLPNEESAYRRLTQSLGEDFKPCGEAEAQLVQKLIDCHTRLNRIAAIENNLLAIDAEGADSPDGILAQTAAWQRNEKSFDLMSRYGSRIARQLILFQQELTRLQTLRKQAQKDAQTTEIKELKGKLASLRTTEKPMATQVPMPTEISKTKPIHEKTEAA